MVKAKKKKIDYLKIYKSRRNSQLLKLKMFLNFLQQIILRELIKQASNKSNEIRHPSLKYLVKV